MGRRIDRVAYVMWSGFSYLFFLIAISFFVRYLFVAQLSFETGEFPMAWEVLVNVLTGWLTVPAIFALFGFLFRRFAKQVKPNKLEPRKPNRTTT